MTHPNKRGVDMEEFALEGLKELYRQEKGKLDELKSKEIEKTLCDIGLELLKDIQRADENHLYTQVAEEKNREFFDRRKKVRASASEKYTLQKNFVSKIETRLAEQYGLIPEVDPQEEIKFRKKESV